MSPEKLKSIQDWLKPWKFKDFQSFLESVNFYWKFIDDYSGIVTPFTCLTCKDIPWNFCGFCHSTFQNLKNAFTSAAILTHLILNTPIIVKTDVSNYAITGILSIHILTRRLGLSPTIPGLCLLQSSTTTLMKRSSSLYTRHLDPSTIILKAPQLWLTLSWPQEPGVLCNHQTPDLEASLLIRVPLQIQPHLLLPP